jgi:hypothetical protein
VQARIRSTLSRTGQGQLAESAFSAFAPQPSFKSPQTALRATMHGPAGELGFTAGTALEHLPALSFSQTFLDYLGTLPNYTSWQRTCEAEPLSDDCSRGIMAARKADNALLADPHPIAVHYDRFELFSIDGATALGPLQVGAEVAYMLNRTQLSAPSLAGAKNGEVAVPVHTDMAHAGLRVEWVRGETWVIAVEASAERAVKLPHDPNRRYLFTTYYGWLLAALGFVTMAPFEEGPTFELGGGVLNGPSYILTPRLEQRIVDRFYIETGAYLLFGKRRPLQDPRVTLGGLYKDSNQVFVGLRWLP